MSNPTTFTKPLAAGVTLRLNTADQALSFTLETGENQTLQLQPEQARIVMKFFELPDTLPGERRRIGGFPPRAE